MFFLNVATLEVYEKAEFKTYLSKLIFRLKYIRCSNSELEIYLFHEYTYNTI